MASFARIVPENVPGEWFVDDTCIDCDTCRQLAPQVFGQADETSFVHTQPAGDDAVREAAHALLACPTGSIGTRGRSPARAAASDFPLPIEGDVFYCGYASPKSFGGSSYFIRHADGNWLVDAPKFLPTLVRKFADAGGLAHIFLTHRDDVADADKYARHFAAERIIHRLELDSQPAAERVLDSFDRLELSPGFVAIPSPGHTRGHTLLLHANRYLFTGDHLAWDRDASRLTAFRDYCWYSWLRQRESMARLLAECFEWVLPGHGQRAHLPAADMQRQLADLIRRMA